jgi:integrase
MSRRRSPGEGSVFKRKDGRWQATLSLGEGRRKSVYGHTRGEAAEKLRALQVELARGLPLPSDERLTVGQYFPDWLATHALTIAPQSVATYDALLRTHIVPALGSIRLTRLSPHRLEAFYADLVAAGLAPRTIRIVHSILRAGLERAARHGLVARNVVTLVSPPRIPHHEIQPLTRDEARRLLAAARGHRLETLFVLALATGMRIGELLALRWEDLDLERAQLQVRRTMSVLRRPRRLSFAQPKTTRGRRRILLGAPALVALRAHRREQLQERLVAGAAWAASASASHEPDLVFTTPHGAPLDPGSVRRLHSQLRRQAGLPAGRFHDLRHTCATLLLAGNVNPKVVAELLGHNSISVTLDVYSHVLPGMLEDAAAVLAQVLEGGGS